MNLENQVASLELCKKLKELGVKQESYFYWSTDTGSNFFIETESYPVYADYPKSKRIYSAFNVSELLNLLPPRIDIKKDEPFNFFNLVIQKKTAANIKYIINYHCDSIQYDESLSDALAKMLIYLIENKLYEFGTASS